MASITHESGGRKTIQFVDGWDGGKRKSLRLGKMLQNDAEIVRVHVERLLAAAVAQTTPPADTQRWLGSIGDSLRDKLADHGFVEARHRMTLSEFAEQYTKTRPDWGVGMRAQFGLAVKNARTFFGADRRLEMITRADGDAFRAYLSTRVAPATARKRMRLVKHLLRAAVRSGLIGENPLADQKTAFGGNRERMRYIDPKTVAAVADELTGETKLVFLLARYAGLRVPSEAHALRWTQVDFEHDVIRVFAPKTKTTRTVPLLPVVRTELLIAFDKAPDGAEYVIQHQHPLPVIRRYVEAAIARAGLTAWPRLLQQLRASFATDCVRTLPANAAAAILGHSAKVAAEHYWMTDETDMQRATQALGALQNPVQQPASRLVGRAPESQPSLAETPSGTSGQAFATQCETGQTCLMGADGFEPS
jgi:integrase